MSLRVMDCCEHSRGSFTLERMRRPPGSIEASLTEELRALSTERTEAQLSRLNRLHAALRDRSLCDVLEPDVAFLGVCCRQLPPAAAC